MPSISLKNIAYKFSPKKFHPLIRRIEASDIGSRLASGAFWSMFGAIISRGLMLAASIFVARILGKEVYGEYGIVRSTVNMFLIFAGFGLGLTATKHVAEYRNSDPERAGRIIAISGFFSIVTGLIVCIGILIFADVLAAKTLNAPHLANVLRIGSGILFLNALNGAQTGALVGFEAFKTIAHVNLVVGILSFPFLVGGAYIGGLNGAIWGLAVNMGINWLLNHIFLRKEAKKYNIPFSSKNCFIEWPILWKFSLPAMLSGIMMAPVLWVGNAILVNYHGGFGQVALFEAANQWRIAILFVPRIVSNIALPILSKMNSHNDMNNYNRTLLLNIKVNVYVTSILILIVSVMSKIIMKSYGNGFSEGYWILIILVSSSILTSVSSVLSMSIASLGRMWLLLVFNLEWAVIFLLFASILIHMGYGAFGLAIAVLISYFFNCVLQLFYAFIKTN